MICPRRLAGAVLAAALLVGCSGSPAAAPSPVPESTRSPTYRCARPDGSSSPTPCTPQEYQQSREQAALVEEAKAVWWRQFEEERRLTLAGGVASLTPTPEIEATMADPGKITFLNIMKQSHDLGITTVKLEYRLKTRWDPTPIHEEALVTLQGCVDNRGSIFIDRNGKDLGQPSGIVLERWGFKRFDGKLKMTYTNAEEVEACPF
ncbi:MAG: hypothetical protein Q4G45_11485 [Actinomycetia bacterium]|nr:hypothetical protein [Actinomycetes bacterium]